MCIESWNVDIVRRWIEVATQEEIEEAIEIPSQFGTPLCMAAALKKDHEIGNLSFSSFFYFTILY